VRQIEGGFLINPLLPLALESSKIPILSRNDTLQFAKLKEPLKRMIPELNDPDYLVAFLCSHGNSSMAVNTLLSQLGFNNVCSLKGGTGALTTSVSDEFCPVPGGSLARSSIDFVKKIAVSAPNDYYTFMQYENFENIRAHEKTTGPELLEQIPGLGAVICTFGTGGTATGLAKFFQDTKVKVIVAFPESPVAGIRTIKGADGLMFYRPELYARIVEVNNRDSDRILTFLMNRGLLVGPSTAVAVAAAMDLSVKELVQGETIAAIAADGIENYSRLTELTYQG
jgi:rhodanese-related sulfurtransferase